MPDDSSFSADDLTSDEVRSIGIALNGGRSYGWREKLSELTGASSYTIRSWCDSESTATHRTCSGPAARLLRVLKDLHGRNVDVNDYMRGLMVTPSR